MNVKFNRVVKANNARKFRAPLIWSTIILVFWVIKSYAKHFKVKTRNSQKNQWNSLFLPKASLTKLYYPAFFSFISDKGEKVLVETFDCEINSIVKRIGAGC